MLASISRLFGNKTSKVFFHQPRKSQRASQSSSRTHFEPLETRRVFAVLSSGVLTVKGTDAPDTIRVTQNGQYTWVEHTTESGGIGSTSYESFKGVTFVKVYGYGSSDKINLAGLPIKSYISGGSGDDYLYGGQLQDTIYGDKNRDTIYGNEGSDILDGGTEDDFLYGYIGDDKLYGGDGNDYLKGNDGLDDMYGGKGADTLIGDAGRDTFWGGVGNDRIEYRFDLDNFFVDQPRLSSSMSEYGNSANGVDTWVITLEKDSLSKRFMQPAMERIGAATAVFDPFLNLLNRNIPVVSKLAGPITFANALARVSPTAKTFMDRISTIRSLANSVGDWSGDVTFGNFKITAGKASIEAAVSTVSANPISAINSPVLKSLQAAGFKFPILESPASLIHMMFGRLVSFVEIGLPRVSTTYTFANKTYRVPVTTGVDVKFTLSAAISAYARGNFGVDSSGLLAKKLISNGFYLRDVSGTIGASITGSGGVAIGTFGIEIVGAGVEGKVGANVTFALKDPNGDGKIRTSELSSSTFAGSITKTGSIDYRVRAYFEYRYLHTAFEVRKAKKYYLLDEGTCRR